MKKNSKSTKFNYNSCDNSELKYYGIFKLTKGKVKIDSKRFKKEGSFFGYVESMDKIMNKRNTKYFFPKYINRDDYFLNIFKDSIRNLKNDWNYEYKGMIKSLISPKNIEESAISDDRFMGGIIDIDEARSSSRFRAIKRENKYQFLIVSFIAQNIHNACSTIEATTLVALSKKGYNPEKFNRNDLYKYLHNESNIDVQKFKNFYKYDKLYSIWNFLKHNSQSSFDIIKNKYPELLFQHDSNYENGILAINYLKLDLDLLDSLLDGILSFYEEISIKVFKESPEEAFWNYCNYFKYEVKEQIDDFGDPLGLRYEIF